MFCSQQLNHNLVQLLLPEGSFITTCVTIIKTFCGTSYEWNTELNKKILGDYQREFDIY